MSIQQKIISLVLIIFVAGFARVVRFDNNWGKTPLINIIDQSPSGMNLVFSMHEMVIEDVNINGVMMQNFGVPGVFLPTDEGSPNLPAVSRYIAIPQGARVQVEILDMRTEVYHNVLVAPAPKIPEEGDDSPLQFHKDLKIYSRNAYFPEQIIRVSKPRKIRGVDVVILAINPFRYNPVTKELIIYKDIKLKVEFLGGNGHFGEDRLRSRFWEPILQGNLLNYESLPKIDFYSPARIQARAGYEYIIIVPDDATFEAWADTLKRWRKLQGISCEVYTLTEVGGSDSASIKNFLQNAYNTWDPAPVAFLLLSDYPSSGDAYGITSPHVYHPTQGTMVSDNWYADFDGDTLPELHHARICAQTNADLSTMINKMLDYERNPYTSANFYNNPLVAGAWQTSRWFQLCCEVIRGFFINGLGKNPVRQYRVYAGTPSVGCAWSTATNTRTVVQYWYNTGWLDDTLNQHNSTWWNNGSVSGINSAINAGAFLVQHRDHGGIDGWGEPSYDTTDLNGLTNTMFPFVYSTNCQTGWYDYTSRCFTEKFHRITHGALGVNAATRNSASFVNDTYIWGTYDCLWPQFDPGYPFYGMTGYDNLRPCMAQTYGKYYLAVHNWPSNPEDKARTYGLFHHHGDCFMTLHSEVPQNLTVSHEPNLVAGDTFFTVTANDSSVIALTVNGEIIGVAEGTGGPVDITIPAQSAGDTMVVTVTKANYRRYSANVPIISNTFLTLYTYNVGTSTDYTAISAYRDTMILVHDYHGENLWVRYSTSYNGGNTWYWYFFDDTTTIQESPDVTARAGGGEGVIYRFYTSPRELRYTWRNYQGTWTSPVSIADNEPYYNKPSIEYLGDGVFGVVYQTWTNPYPRAAYFDRSDWIVGIDESKSDYVRKFSFAPNPVTKEAQLSYNVQQEGPVKISIYDVTGRLVNRLVDGSQKSGTYNLKINGAELANGIYFLHIETPEFKTSRSFIVIK